MNEIKEKSQLPCSNKILLLFDTSPDNYFTLERQPGIEGAIGVENLKYLHIQDLPEDVFVASEIILDAVRDYKPEYIFTWVGHLHQFSLEVLSEISLMDVKTVGFIGDEELDSDYFINFTAFFDYAVIYTKELLTKFNSKFNNAYLLPVGASFENFNENSISVVEDIDVLFIGRPYGIRGELINFLIRNNINVKVAGINDWLKYIPAENYIGFVDNAEYNHLLSRSKIILSMMEMPNGTGTHINAKVFDAAKVEKLAIASKYSPFYTTYGLIENQSIVTYENKCELLEKVKRYLKNDADRVEIAKELSKVIRGKFDYSYLYKKLFNEILESKARINNTAKLCLIEQTNKNNYRFYDVDKNTSFASEDLNGVLQNYDYVILNNNSKDKAKYYHYLNRWLYLYKGSSNALVLKSNYRGVCVTKRLGVYDVSSVCIPVQLFNREFLGRKFLLNNDLENIKYSPVALNEYISASFITFIVLSMQNIAYGLFKIIKKMR